jgi:hypothetical protein
MPSSRMLGRVALVRSDVSDERSVSIIRVTRIGELGTLPITSNRLTHAAKKYKVSVEGLAWRTQKGVRVAGSSVGL